ncbi:MAG: hypothetical protein LQ339_007755 [Xanthoria mediterranea]|nr:MAG: hypothetical protein LQ339_007755 [Xanthoria mediterranea]
MLVVDKDGELKETELSSWVHATPEDNLSLASVGDSAHTIGPYIGSGTALGFKLAKVVGKLLAEAGQQPDIPAMLQLNEVLRRRRTDLVRGVTQRIPREWMLPDGPLQVDRDDIFVHEEPPSAGLSERTEEFST